MADDKNQVQKPELGEIAPPESPYGLTSSAASGASAYSQLLQPTDTVLASKGGIENLQVYHELLRDSQVFSVFGQRRLALTSCVTVVEAGADDALSKQAAEALDAQLKAINWDDITDKMLYSAFYGWGVGEIMWAQDGALVKLAGIKVRERERFRFDRLGNIYLLKAMGQIERMRPDKMWVMRHGGSTHDAPYGLGLAHALYWPVWFKRNVDKFWLVFVEKFGQPTAIAKMPAGQMQDPKKIAEGKAMLRHIATDAGVVIPDDIVIELLEAARSGTGGYEQFHDAMDAAISKVILGQTMTTDNGASLSQAKVHERVAQAITEADSDLLCGSFNAQVVAPWLAWNFPGAVPPRVYRQTAPEEDKKARAERDSKIYAMGYEPTEEYIKEVYGDGWVKRQVQPAPVFGQQQDAPAQFSESDQLAMLKAARRIDQDTLMEAAKAIAQDHKTVTGQRVNELLRIAEMSESYERFERGIDELIGQPPARETMQSVGNASFMARLSGMARALRRAA